MKELIEIQSKLNAPKNMYNKFGGYAYRSAEGILEAVKPLLKEQGCTLTLTDEIILIGERYYVKATTTLTSSDGATVSVSALAREEESKKGMDGSQITGAASSYARKYALNGLFCIDDTKDADTMDNTDSGKKPAREADKTAIEDAVRKIGASATTEELNAVWSAIPKELKTVKEIRDAVISTRKQKNI